MTVALFFWAFIQNLILGVAIALLRNDRTNYLLAGIFLLTGANVLTQYTFHYTNLKYTFPQVVWLPDIIDLMIPGLLLLYLMRVLNVRWPARPYLYFLPAAATLLVLTANVLITPDFGFFDYIRTDLHRAVLMSVLVWKVFMLWEAARLLQAHRTALRAKSSARYGWPALLCVFLAASALLATINLVHMTWLAGQYPPDTLHPIREAIQFIFVVFNSSIVLAVLYYLVRHPKILSGRPILKPLPAAPEREERNRSRELLLRAVEEDQVYLDGDLNEKRLAAHLDMPPYALSRLLNEEIGQTFSHFINTYRIREAQRVLRADVDKEKTNFAIALESGFRSESVFYVNFKKLTGTTPSRFRKRVRQELLADR